MLQLRSRELWEGESSPIVVGGGAYRRKRKTKSQLVAQFYREEERMSPVINTKVQESADDVKEGIPYQIVNVEDIDTEVQQFSGIRVSLETATGKEGNVVLWKRRVTGRGSKLGVFMTELGENTDRWLKKWVIFKVWQPRNRIMEVIPAPVPKAPKAPKKKAS